MGAETSRDFGEGCEPCTSEGNCVLEDDTTMQQEPRQHNHAASSSPESPLAPPHPPVPPPPLFRPTSDRPEPHPALPASSAHSDFMRAYLEREISQREQIKPQQQQPVMMSTAATAPFTIAAPTITAHMSPASTPLTSSSISTTSSSTAASSAAAPSSSTQDLLLLKAQLESITSTARRKQQFEHERMQAELILKYQHEAMKLKQEYEAHDLQIQQLHQLHQAKVNATLLSTEVLESQQRMVVQHQHQQQQIQQQQRMVEVKEEKEQEQPTKKVKLEPQPPSTVAIPFHHHQQQQHQQHQQQQQQYDHPPLTPNLYNNNTNHGQTPWTPLDTGVNIGDDAMMLYDPTTHAQTHQKQHEPQHDLYVTPYTPSAFLSDTGNSNNENVTMMNEGETTPSSSSSSSPHTSSHTTPKLDPSSYPSSSLKNSRIPPEFLHSTRELSSKFLKTYQETQFMQLCEAEYQAGRFSASAVRAMIMWSMSELLPEHQSILIQSFKCDNLVGCVHAFVNCPHVVTSPMANVPCCMVGAPLEWGGSWLYDRRMEYLADASHFHCPVVYEKLKKLVAQANGVDANITQPLGDDDLDRLKLDRIGMQLMAPFFSRWRSLSTTSKDLSPSEAVEDDPDCVARLLCVMLFSLPKEKTYRGQKQPQSESSHSSDGTGTNTTTPSHKRKRLTSSGDESCNDEQAATISTTSSEMSTLQCGFTDSMKAPVTPSDIAFHKAIHSHTPPIPSTTSTSFFEPNCSLHRSITMNKAFERLTGWKQSGMSELLDTSWLVKHIRCDHIAPMHRILTLWQFTGQKEGHVYQVRTRCDGSIFYCIMHIKVHLDHGLFLGAAQSILPLPESQPMPPYVPGVDLTADVIMHGYQPPVPPPKLELPNPRAMIAAAVAEQRLIEV